MKPTNGQQMDFAAIETPHRGAELLRKLMTVARHHGHVRRYFSLRRAWVAAVAREGGSK
jgi:hypothetical protein